MPVPPEPPPARLGSTRAQPGHGHQLTTTDTVVLIGGHPGTPWRFPPPIDTGDQIDQLALTRPLILLDDGQTPSPSRHLIQRLVVPELTTQAALAALDTIRHDEPLAGITTFDDQLTPLVAAVAKTLGLPGHGVTALAVMRDRWRLIDALRTAGIAPTTPLIPAATPAAAAAAAATIGFPLLISPPRPHHGFLPPIATTP
ncbi:hypothetical protein, partial [Thermoactinospora rubra]|uniref:hypothetical protein n=1 Tax=Thermoactinospora rubra TaxID=1088767 RepID=UPI003B84653C